MDSYFTPSALFVFGLLVGSFSNVCILRLPEKQSVVTPRSCCPRCNTLIAWYDNVPLLSWLLLRGRCRHCGEPISFRYFVVELVNGLLALAAWWKFGFGVEWAVAFLFLTALLIITVIDLDHRIIPDVISLPGIMVGFVLSFRGIPGPLDSGLGILFGGGILLAVAWAYATATGREGMGGGDIKLLGMIGAFLGWASVPFTLLVSSLTGSVIGLSLMWWTGSDSKYAIPFGPFLALGAVVYLFFGPELVAWYMSFGPPL